MIKSSASSSQAQLQPYKLSLLDQIVPALYFPLILFYPISNSAFNLPQTLAHLREAFSKTLTLCYPLSGRVKNNLYIDDFKAGIPYVEARVKCDMDHMIDFLGFPNIHEGLSKLVPLKPFSMEAVTDKLYPLLGVQVNVFGSGQGIGVCFSHKLNDGVTADGFLKSWGAIFRVCRDEIIHPSLSQAAALFPSREDLPEIYKTLLEESCFAEKKVVARRFVFDSEALSEIQDEAKSEFVLHPSRVQSLTGFLWKHMIAASRAITAASQAVNVRSKMDKDTTLYNNVIGNLIWGARSTMLKLNHNAQDSSGDLKLCDLVVLLDKSLKQNNNDYFKCFTGEKGYISMCEYLDMLWNMSSMKSAPEVYTFTNCTRFYNDADFGLGRTSLIGVNGKLESAYHNITILNATKCGTGIDAWCI